MHYVFASTKEWDLRAFAERRPRSGRWLTVSNAEQLANAVSLSPRYIFFVHWSSVIPAEILASTECVCFHMTDVPYGRGGSPLQNLISRGHTDTKLTALRMTGELDGGPVYLKYPLSLAGSATEIFERAAVLAIDMIREIIDTGPKPVPQSGTPVVFKRRRPDQSRITGTETAAQLYDHIRMLDADTYPRAFLEFGRFRIVFSEVSRQTNSLRATVQIEEISDG